MFLIEATILTKNEIETAYYLTSAKSKTEAEQIAKSNFPSAVSIVRKVDDHNDRLWYLCTRRMKMIGTPQKDNTT